MARIVKFSQKINEPKPLKDKNLLLIENKIVEFEKDITKLNDTLDLITRFETQFTCYVIVSTNYGKYNFNFPVNSIQEYDLICRVISNNNAYDLLNDDIYKFIDYKFLKVYGNLLDTFVFHLNKFNEDYRIKLKRNAKKTILSTVLLQNYTDNSTEIHSLEIYQSENIYNDNVLNKALEFLDDSGDFFQGSNQQSLIKFILNKTISDLFPYLYTITYNNSYSYVVFDSTALSDLYLASLKAVDDSPMNERKDYLTLRAN